MRTPRAGAGQDEEEEEVVTHVTECTSLHSQGPFRGDGDDALPIRLFASHSHLGGTGLLACSLMTHLGNKWSNYAIA